MALYQWMWSGQNNAYVKFDYELHLCCILLYTKQHVAQMYQDVSQLNMPSFTLDKLKGLYQPPSVTP